MKLILDFLKPTWMKLIFLVELPLFFLIELGRKGTEVFSGITTLLLPAFFYYLIGCTLVSFYQKRKSGLRVEIVLIAVAGFLLVDQGAKWVIVTLLDLGDSIPLLPGLLHLSYAQNVYGSWLFGDLVGHGFLLVFIILCLLITIASYRYYRNRVRTSVLADMAFVFLVVSFISAFFEIGVRGYVVDFLQLPGYVTADIKDIYLWIGVACVLIETFEGGHGKMSLREFGNALVRMVRYNLYHLVSSMSFWICLVGCSKN
jgi:signal peptidase II